jgi:hypothetical protein
MEKSSHNMWAISAIFNKLPNRQLGEISPNLVTLKKINSYPDSRWRLTSAASAS